MKRLCHILFCIGCAAAGFGTGRYVWTAPVSDPSVIDSSKPPSARVASQGATQAIAGERSGLRRAALILEIAARGERNKLPGLIAACQGDVAALQLLADAWLRIDPGAFVRALASSEAMQESGLERVAMLLHDVLVRWDEKDPDAAWRATKELPRNFSRHFLQQLALLRVERDPKTGLEFVLSHPGTALPLFNKKLENGTELLPLIRQLPDSAGKMHIFTRALSGLPVAEAMAALGDPTENSTENARSGILRNAAKENVEEVIAWHAQATGRSRHIAAQVIGEVLLTKDPAAALDWAKEHLSGFYRMNTIKKAADLIDSKDPAAAAAARALLPENFKPKAPGN